MTVHLTALRLHVKMLKLPDIRARFNTNFECDASLPQANPGQNSVIHQVDQTAFQFLFICSIQDINCARPLKQFSVKVYLWSFVEGLKLFQM